MTQVVEVAHAHPSTTSVEEPAPLSPKGRWALAYVQAGYKVIPTCTPSLQGACDQHGPGCRRPGKVPRLTWAQYQHGEITIDAVRRWWTAWPNANLAVLCGQSIGPDLYLAVLDVERSGLGVLTSAPLPPTVTLHSQGGGLHFWLTTPWPLKSRLVHVAGVPLGDLRAAGSLATVPPSDGLLGPYSWATGRDPGSVYVAPAPDWLLSGSQVQPAAAEPTPAAKAHGFQRPLDRPPVLDMLSTKLRELFEFDYGLVDRSALDFRVAVELLQQGMDPLCVQQVLLWPNESKALEKLKVGGARACHDYIQRTLRNAARRAAVC